MILRTVVLLCAFALFSVDSVANAGLIVHDSRFSATQRLGASPQTWPLAVDANGSIYSVTGTASSDDLIRLNTDNTVTTLNNHVGRVVGVIADMEIGFDGDLYANYAQLPKGASGTHGVVRFDKTTGAATTFYSDSSFNADGGLAFDAANSVLYMQSQLPAAPLLALDAAGTATTIVPALGDGRGLALESSGTLITIGKSEIRRVDVSAATVTTIRDIASDLPGFLLRSVDTLSTGEIVFTAQNETTQSRNLYSIAPTGGPLNLIATDSTWGPHQIKVGIGSDGIGESLYINNPNTLELHELQFTPVPEPGTFVLFATGTVVAVLRRQQLQNRT